MWPWLHKLISRRAAWLQNHCFPTWFPVSKEMGGGREREGEREVGICSTAQNTAIYLYFFQMKVHIVAIRHKVICFQRPLRPPTVHLPHADFADPQTQDLSCHLRALALAPFHSAILTLSHLPALCLDLTSLRSAWTLSLSYFNLLLLSPAFPVPFICVTFYIYFNPQHIVFGDTHVLLI